MAQANASQGAPRPGGASYHDYAAKPKGGIFASPRVAAAVLAAAVLFGTLYGSHRSLNAARPEIQYSGTSIQRLLGHRAATALNLANVAARYLADGYPIDLKLIDEIRIVARDMAYDPPTRAMPDLDRSLTELTEQLMDELEALPLSEQDARYLAGFRAELASNANQIEHDPYHLQAERFNDMLRHEFPANILGPLTGVQPATVF